MPSHYIHQRKLQQNGIKDLLPECLKCYHIDRYTFVNIGDSRSDSMLTEERQALGSILALFEYLLYVNEMNYLFTFTNSD